MEGLIGITFKDYVLMAADRSLRFSVINMKNDEKKIYKLSDSLILGVNGEPGDTTQFAEFIEKNVKLYSIRNGFELSPSSAAHFIQRNLADALRSRSAYQVNLLIGGFNKHTNTAELFFLDHLATLSKVPFAIHGYPGFVATSVLDRLHNPNVNLDEGINLLRKVVAEVQKRLIISMPVFSVVAVSKDGVQLLDDIRIGPEAIA